MQTLIKAALLGALAASTRISSTDRDGVADQPTVMPQLAAESAVAARISRPTADSELEDLVLVQTEDLRDSLTDELLLAQSAQRSATMSTTANDHYKRPDYGTVGEEECQELETSTADDYGRWYKWAAPWPSNPKKECWCYGSTWAQGEGWIETSSQDYDERTLC